MQRLHQYQILAHYNQWMNEQLYNACAALSDDERKLDMKAFFGSIHGTLNHILLADRVWLGRIRQQPSLVKSLDQELYADFHELAQQRSQTDSEITQMVADLTLADLDRPITYRSFSKNQESTHRLNFVLLHLFNHQTHHRGQVTALLSQLDHDFGVTDLIACPQPTSLGRFKNQPTGAPRNE